MSNRTHGRAAAFFAAAAWLLLAVSAAWSQGLARDSDDWVCHHGHLHSDRTLEACARLEGHPVSLYDAAALRRGGRLWDSDDYRCHHGRPDARRTLRACARLRGD